MQLDVKALGVELGALISDSLVPMRKELEELRAKYAALEARQPEKGEQGPPGPAGKDAPPVAVSEVIRELIESEELLSLIELRVKEEVSKIPPPKDGKDGEPGPRGEKGEQGPAGKDGAGIQDLLIDRDGNLVATMTDGRTKSLGVVVGRDGAPGKDGKDGADFTDVEFDYDGERTLIIRGKGGEIKKRLPIPIDRGYWREGEFEKGDIVTEGGTAYIALRTTKVKPSTETKEDWRILARKGRDGKDGRNGIDKTAPVKL